MRTNSMARFNEEIPLSLVLRTCENCSEELYEDELIVYHDGDVYCNSGCFAEFSGTVYKLLEKGD